jgi:LytR cell envelope-related transcriptional attenuator
MVLIAFSLQDQVEKYGAYVGIAAFFGLAILSLLYFAQAREVKRLREWAGRAPERAAELEQAVAEHAEEVRRAPVTPEPQPQPVAAQALSPSVATTNGAVKLKPEEVAALAFARAAGVREPHEPRAHPVPAATAAVAAPPTEVAAAGAAVATGEPAAAQALNGGNGGGSRTVPAPATPAARRADPPPPLPPRRAAGTPGRRPTAPPPRRETSNTLAVVVTAVVGVLALAAVVFLFTRSGGDANEPQSPNVVPTATATATAESNATQTPAPTKETALIAVYNGTTQDGLAATIRDALKGEGYPEDNLAADTAPPEQQRQTSVVMYRRGAKAAASGVAEALGITDVQQLDAATQALIANAPKKWNVVVIVGNDKTN